MMSHKYSFSVDLRLNFPEVRDQGRRGTCTAFAVTSSHEHHRNLNERLSEEFLFSCAKSLQGAYDDSGVSIPTALESIVRWGHTTNTLLPYNESSVLPLKFKDIPPVILKDAKSRKIASYNTINQIITHIESQLKKERSVIAGVVVHPTFWLTADNNFIDVPAIESVEGYHAIVIVGYGERDDGKKCFIIRNSWGSDWGDSGYAYISYDYFIKYNMGAWIIPRGA
ncbi:C1 family peptidase [Neobacillus soli]|uniref:C1 family peptidase n=1 Tax=Neobacillus soli TaxID=220688 RepID=UPI0008265609|nr:C1 family peptidase [Neobacillus soli]